MALENKLNIIDSAELARVEERISKKRAILLFESGYLHTLKGGTLDSLLEIHRYLFDEIYDFAGKVRTVREPSPITDTMVCFPPVISLALTSPRPAEIEVELCPVSKTSHMLSLRFGKPLRP